VKFLLSGSAASLAESLRLSDQPFREGEAKPQRLEYHWI
jgi:hypothetical protein